MIQPNKSSLALSAAACGLALASCGTEAPAPYGPLPTPQQVEWQKMETNMFCHFGPNTFTSAEWGSGQEDGISMPWSMMETHSGCISTGNSRTRRH